MMGYFRKTLSWMTLSAALAGASACAHADAAELVYVGTQAGQLRVLRFDPANGALTPIGTAAEGGSPTWTVAHSQLPILYVVDDDKTREGSVTAYAVNRGSGALARINTVASGGSGTTHLAFDARSSTLFAANFGGGSASSIAVKPDGSLGALVSTVKATGSGPHRRQAAPHAHAVSLDPSGRYALVPDLGADRVFVYGFDPATRVLAPDAAPAPRTLAVAPGSGPRRAVFAMQGRYVYVLNELKAEILALRWDARQGRLTPLQSPPPSPAQALSQEPSQALSQEPSQALPLPTVLALSSAGFGGVKSGSEIAASPDGRFLYAGNRGEHAIQVYRVQPETGELALVQRIASGGETPWGFALHPSGKWLVAANQRSGKLAVFGVDTATGLLADTGQAVDAPSPVSVTFVR